MIKQIKEKRKKGLRIPTTVTPISTYEMIMATTRKGCSFITRAQKLKERLQWEWGDSPKSYMTFQNDRIEVPSRHTFVRAYKIVNAAILPPRDRYLSIQILNRTNWTNYKYMKSIENREINDIRHLALCENCGEHEEHTMHLIF